MLAQVPGSHRAERLCCKINAHVVQDRLIVQEGILTMPSVFFTRRETVMLQKIQFVIANLASIVNAFANPTCNGNARFEAWLFARLG